MVRIKELQLVLFSASTPRPALRLLDTSLSADNGVYSGKRLAYVKALR